MSFPNGIEPTPPGVRVHPTPLYELGMGLLIGWYLWWRGGKKHGTGAIVGEYLVLSGIARFLVEFIRRNPKIVLGAVECAAGEPGVCSGRRGPGLVGMRASL